MSIQQQSADASVSFRNARLATQTRHSALAANQGRVCATRRAHRCFEETHGHSIATRKPTSCISSLRATGEGNPRIHTARRDPGRLAGDRLRGGHCLPGAARRADGERLNSRRGAFHQHLQVAGAIDHPRKQHRADGGFGGRIHRCRCGFHLAGADFPRLFARCFGYPPRSAAGAGGKRAGRPFCDSLAAPVERGGARRADVSGRHRLRGRAHRGRKGRQLRGKGLCRFRSGACLQVSE